MVHLPDAFASHARPDRDVSLEQYRWRASVYDNELVMFEPLRREAIEHLALKPGEKVLDVGCGTGLSFGLLAGALGEGGTIIGIEPCPEMLARARERQRLPGWPGIELVNAPAGEAPLRGQRADAALFHFTHDVLRQPTAIDHILRHLRPGARVVATGLRWSEPWAWPVNLFVWGAAMYSVSTLEGLSQPWSCLAARLPGLKVSSTWMGGIYMASGVWQGPSSPSSEAI
jgi:SAM-dependent methyltransferase